MERDEVLDGLDTNERRNYLVERFKRHKLGDSQSVFMIRGGFDIRRDDGKLATIDTSMLDRGSFTFVVWTEEEISEGWRQAVREEGDESDDDGVGCVIL